MLTQEAILRTSYNLMQDFQKHDFLKEERQGHKRFLQRRYAKTNDTEEQVCESRCALIQGSERATTLFRRLTSLYARMCDGLVSHIHQLAGALGRIR